jgi:16S rRNA (adenine1518-N6/adenine1519-N6)-dimethyltransferase
MLQREMAARLSAQPGSKAWGRLSVMAQLTFAIDPLFDVGPKSFSPPPKVHSTVVRFTPKENLRLEVDLEVFDRVLRMAFAARRKRLSNALRSFALDWASAPVEPHMRADAISLDEYVQLARLVAQTHNTDA